MTQHEWKCVRQSVAVCKQGDIYRRCCHTACSVPTGDIVELPLNLTGVDNRAIVAVHVALESIWSNTATSVWLKNYVKTVALLKYIKQFGDFVASVVMEEWGR